MTKKLVTEIITVHSLQELYRQIESEISSYLSRKEDYSERLGDFLREAEEKYGEEDWFRELIENLGGEGRNRNNRRRRRRRGAPDNWVHFKSLLLSSTDQGEAEIMFETIQAITEKLEQLEDAKESLEELKNVGLGNDVDYICYLKDGVVVKIVLKPVDSERESKFALNLGFTTLQRPVVA